MSSAKRFCPTALAALAALLLGCATAGELNPAADAAAGEPDGLLTLQDAKPNAPDAPPGTPDAAPSHIDGAPGPDAIPPHIDAAPLPIDAAPPPVDAACTPTVVNLLANPNFDLGHVNWVESSYLGWDIIVESADLLVAPHTGSWAVWMGGDYDEDATLYQTVTVPAGATNLQVTGYRWIATEETSGTYDFAQLQIQNGSGTPLEQLTEWSNANSTTAWTAFTFTPSGSYAGQTIRLSFHATCDDLYNTNFFFDTVALKVTVCM